jgi:hypothetical protein
VSTHTTQTTGTGETAVRKMGNGYWVRYAPNKREEWLDGATSLAKAMREAGVENASHREFSAMLRESREQWPRVPVFAGVRHFVG